MVLGRFAVPLLWVHCIWSVVRDLCITYARKGLRNVIRSADSEASPSYAAATRMDCFESLPVRGATLDGFGALRGRPA